MSIEHPALRGWFPLQDGHNLNVNQIVWFRAGTRQLLSDQEPHDERYIELMLSNGAMLVLNDPADRENFAKLVGTIE